jgi:hypothetical protein
MYFVLPMYLEPILMKFISLGYSIHNFVTKISLLKKSIFKNARINSLQGRCGGCGHQFFLPGLTESIVLQIYFYIVPILRERRYTRASMGTDREIEKVHTHIYVHRQRDRKCTHTHTSMCTDREIENVHTHTHLCAQTER